MTGSSPNLISALSSNPITSKLPLDPNLYIYGSNSEVESLDLIHIIAVTEELLEQYNTNIDLFEHAFGSTNELQLKDLQDIIDSQANV